MEIAVRTRQGEIRFRAGTAVLAGDDVLGMETKERVVVLMNVTILATIRGS
jgi:hypothetical protein